jgi:F0F1-type ATP synthase delta subunit
VAVHKQGGEVSGKIYVTQPFRHKEHVVIVGYLEKRLISTTRASNSCDMSLTSGVNSKPGNLFFSHSLSVSHGRSLKG